MASTGRDIKMFRLRKEKVPPPQERNLPPLRQVLLYKCDDFAFGYHIALL